MPVTSRPAAWSDRIAVSRPEPGPFTNTSTFWSPCSMPFFAAESAVTWAAKGVDSREPLTPAPPADSQAITLPSRSVSDTIVLLNDVLIWAWPMAMFFLALRRPRAGRLGAGTLGVPPRVIQTRVLTTTLGLRPHVTVRCAHFLAAFFLPATCMRRGPFRVRALVLVRCPR